MYGLVIFGVVAWLALLITLVLDEDYVFAGVLGGGTVLAVLIARRASKSTASPRRRRSRQLQRKKTRDRAGGQPELAEPQDSS